MRKTREILRLHYTAGLANRAIARTLKLSPATISDCLARARAAALPWPLPESLSECNLEARLYPPPPGPGRFRPLPDWATVHRELQRKGVTLLLLWQEYKTAHPGGLMYSAFCDHYRAWASRLDVVLRQEHRAGDKLFVDYAGQTVPVTDRLTGETRPAQIFVAVLGCSNYSYAEATWTQTLPDWLGSQVRALEYFGGAPAAIVPDNLKSAIKRAHRYDPDLNPAYQDFAEHYGVAVLPARVRKPRDKAKVEAGVLVVERWILARLRHRTFFLLAELNTAIAALLQELNTRPFKKLDGCRRARFESLERPALKPLPAQPYEFAQWRVAKVHPDYHIEVERAYYSVPYCFIHQRLDVRLTNATLEVFHRGTLIAAHRRATHRGEFVTLPAHRPPAHQAVVRQDHARLLELAAAIGPATAALIRRQVQQKCHPEQSLRSAQGILRLATDFSARQLECACEQALALNSHSYRAVRALLTAIPTAAPAVTPLPAHDNLRGSDYFQ
jgi:transposase